MLCHASTGKQEKQLKTMESLEFTLATIVEMARQFTGSQPTFKINFEKQQVEITDACSGFLKVLYTTPKVMAHFHNGIISVQFFTK